MSNPGEQPDLPETTLIQQDGAIPETVIPAEPVTEKPAEPEPEKPAAEAAQEPEKPKRKPWYQDRIDTLTRQRAEEKTSRERLEAELAALKPKDEGEQPQSFDPKQFEQVIEQRAQAMVAQREVQARTKGFISAGEKEFGASDFMEKCNEVAALGAGDSPEFMAIITDAELIPDGHKVIAALAEHPEDAQHILSLPPLKMAAALAKFAGTAKVPEKKISQAPAPIKPIGGTAKASTPNDNDPIDNWMAKRRAELAAKGKF